jgi:muramoyltetrapeptide carboxypeptidase LdcA involved in peptidoglycan recycling
MLRWDWHGRNGLNKNEAYHFFTAPREPTLPVKIRNIYRNPKIITNAHYRDNFYYAHSDRDVTGQLVIGSLPVMVKLCKEGLNPNVTDKIVMLDSLDMSLEIIFDLLQNFNNHCNLSCAAAVIFSSLAERTDRKNILYPDLQDPERVKKFFQEVSKLLGETLPLFHGFPVGHCAYKLTLPIGLTISIIAKNGDLIFAEYPYQ